MISLADMRNRITIRKAAVSMDEYGNRTNSYTDFCTRWAYCNRQSGSETFEAGTTIEKENLYFVVRYDSATRQITAGVFQVVFENKTYNITSVDNYKFRNESITIYAEEVRT